MREILPAPKILKFNVSTIMEEVTKSILEISFFPTKLKQKVLYGINLAQVFHSHSIEKSDRKNNQDFITFRVQEALSRFLLDPVKSSQEKLKRGVLSKHLSPEELQRHEANVQELIRFATKTAKYKNHSNEDFAELLKEEYPELHIRLMSTEDMEKLTGLMAGGCYVSPYENKLNLLGSEEGLAFLKKYSLEGIINEKPLMILQSSPERSSLFRQLFPKRSHILRLHELFHYFQDKMVICKKLLI